MGIKEKWNELSIPHIWTLQIIEISFEKDKYFSPFAKQRKEAKDERKATP